jgi:thiamine-phosphate pyrophosphorylase
MRELHLDPLYPITSAPDHVRLATEYLKAGIRFFQVRDKLLEDARFYQQLLEISKLCSQFGARFVVNDRVDFAMATGAAGVHLGQTDLPVLEARRLLGEQAIIGISTHNREQFLEAQSAPINYVALGPIFETSTKESANKPLGVEFLREVACERRHPLVAIGGICLENAMEIWRAGADSIAVISDITKSGDPARRIEEFLKKRKRC